MTEPIKTKKPLYVVWAQNEEELSLSLDPQQEFHITNKHKLIQGDEQVDDLRRWNAIDGDEEFIHSFYLPMMAPHHTTDYYRWAFNELYPDKDFDKEFETDKPGVVERIRESKYSGIETKAEELKLRKLTDKVAELGYQLQFGPAI